MSAGRVPGTSETVHGYEARTIGGDIVSLETFKGNVLLIVNVASRCGYTPQYRALETLYRRHVSSGFSILAFPCNQFGAQEPGSEDEIADFCDREYDVTFPLFAKVDVNGPGAHPLFTFLKSQKSGWLGMERIQWNFTKFLVDREGHVVARFGPRDTPEAIEPQIVSLLQK